MTGQMSLFSLFFPLLTRSRVCISGTGGQNKEQREAYLERSSPPPFSLFLHILLAVIGEEEY